MGFDEFLENNHGYRRNYGGSRYDDTDRYDRYEGNYSNPSAWTYLLDRMKSNKKLRHFVVIAGVLILATAVVLIIVLLPLLKKLVDYISQNGLQGVFNEFTGFIGKIWKGDGN